MNIVVFDDIDIKNSTKIDIKSLKFVDMVDTLKEYDIIISKDLHLKRDMLDILTNLKFVFVNEKSKGMVDTNYLEVLSIKYFFYNNENDITTILDNI